MGVAPLVSASDKRFGIIASSGMKVMRHTVVAVAVCILGCAKSPDLSAYLGIAPGTPITVTVAIEHRGLPPFVSPPKGLAGLDFSGKLVSISKDEVVVTLGEGKLPMCFKKHTVVSITVNEP